MAEMTEAHMMQKLEELKPFLKEAVKELSVTPEAFASRAMEVYRLAVDKYTNYMLDIAHQHTPKGKALFEYISESVWRRFNPEKKHNCARCNCALKGTEVLCTDCDKVVWKK